MRHSLAILASLTIATGCTSGVASNVSKDNVTFSQSTFRPIGDQTACLDAEMSRSSFRYELNQTPNGWDLSVLIYGGPVVGWFPKARAIRTDQTIDYYSDVGDFGIDVQGIRTTVVDAISRCD
jgi:hypothetical protein